jgi:hypothetical protein
MWYHALLEAIQNVISYMIEASTKGVNDSLRNAGVVNVKVRIIQVLVELHEQVGKVESLAGSNNQRQMKRTRREMGAAYEIRLVLQGMNK